MPAPPRHFVVEHSTFQFGPATPSPSTTPLLSRVNNHALPAVLLIFRLQPAGFANRDLRVITAQLRGLAPGLVSAGQMTYDLRRLKTHGLIERIPRTHRYQDTDHGLHTAMFLTAFMTA